MIERGKTGDRGKLKGDGNMKKLKTFMTAFLLIFALAFSGCTGKNAEPSIDDTDVFEEELTPLTEDEIAELEEDTGFDDEMTSIDESELESLDESENSSADISEEEKDNTQKENEDDSGSSQGTIQVQEDGIYTSKDEVAVYIHTYGHLPSNYITKSEAKELGWVSKEGNLDEVAPGKSIGGDSFGNYEKMLPEEEGRKYYECDIDFDGTYRNEKRIIYSNDGLIFYTGDHYETFEQVY